jgi:hypothetical protein
MAGGSPRALFAGYRQERDLAGQRNRQSVKTGKWPPRTSVEGRQVALCWAALTFLDSLMPVRYPLRDGSWSDRQDQRAIPIGAPCH